MRVRQAVFLLYSGVRDRRNMHKGHRETVQMITSKYTQLRGCVIDKPLHETDYKM